ncbi:1,2-phenylacetyl-CoA epoxidase subunit PaaD [Rhodococcus sp. BH5]|uniref:1,2-phenylacetyl-CoA epoxidase subunit PaaD n=1 Tax=Rhodococcus sp. BH5 TaxID=2871702 RepID=UPI003FA71FCC
MTDPELPMITLADLGVIRSVTESPGGSIEVTITPTFLGCPAITAMKTALLDVLDECGHPDGTIRQQLSPPWTTDWITEEGRRCLSQHKIVPPRKRRSPVPVELEIGTCCPYCGSEDTCPQGLFGAARCQTILKCMSCRESFSQVRTV